MQITVINDDSWEDKIPPIHYQPALSFLTKHFAFLGESAYSTACLVAREALSSRAESVGLSKGKSCRTLGRGYENESYCQQLESSGSS